MTAQPYFVALGDVHLAHTIWRNRPDVTGDAFLGLKNLFDAAKRYKCPAVIVGDLYDQAEQRDASLLQECQKLIDEAHDAGTDIWAIQGNHDKRAVPWYTLHRRVAHFGDGTPVRFSGDGPLVVGLDYDIHDRIKAKLEGLRELAEKPQILFLHQAVKQALKWEGAWNCDLEWIPEGIPLTVMGDIHSEFQCTFRPGQQALYTGSGHPRSVSEFGPRSITLVNTDLTWERVPVWTRPMFNLIWHSDVAAELHRAYETWSDRIPAERRLLVGPLSPFVRLTYTEERVREVTDLKVLFARHCVIWDDVVVPANHDGTVSPRGNDIAIPTPESLLARVIAGRQREAATRLALDLVTTKQDPADVLLAHRSRFVEKASTNG